MLTPFIFHILHHFQWLIKHHLPSATRSTDTWNANTALRTLTSTTTEHILIKMEKSETYVQITAH